MVAVCVGQGYFDAFKRTETVAQLLYEQEISLQSIAALKRIRITVINRSSSANELYGQKWLKGAQANYQTNDAYQRKNCCKGVVSIKKSVNKRNRRKALKKRALLPSKYRLNGLGHVTCDVFVHSTAIPRLISTFGSQSLASRCKKGELFDYLTEVVTLSEKRTRQIMRQLLEAVEYIHSKNIVHRDLKPENILLDDNMNVKLSDFGFATVISHDKELQDLCGTPGYLAPEVLKVSMYDDADGYGKAVDMWACGVIMYTLLVGCPPFWHRKQMYMLRAIMDGRYTFESPEWEDISELPKQLISQLLVVDPLSRLTASEALQHPFFKREERPEEEKKQFFARRLFKAAVITVTAVTRIRNLHLHPPPISRQSVRRDPYATRIFRKAIDAGAFKIYGHWVKRGENQNRAALFENAPKRDLKMAALNGPTAIPQYLQT